MLSIILFCKSIKAKKRGETNVKIKGAVITLALSIVMIIPTLDEIYATYLRMPKAGIYQSEDGSVQLEIKPANNTGDVNAYFISVDGETVMFMLYDDYFILCEFSTDENGQRWMKRTDEILYDKKKDTISFTFNEQDYALTLTD